MADISKIKLPSGSEYNLKDANAIAYNGELLTTNPFSPKSLKGPYISKIDNAFYAADKRWNVSVTGVSHTVANLFDGSYETVSFTLPSSGSATIAMDFTNESGGTFPGYPYGYILLSFYYSGGPQSVTGRVYCNYEPHGIGWHDITFSPISDNTTTSIVYRARQGYYAVSQIEIVVNGAENPTTRVSQLEMHLDRPHSSRNPFLSKYGAEELYYSLTAPNFIGKVNNHTVNSDVPANAKFTDTTYTGTAPITVSSSNVIAINDGTTAQKGAVKLNTATNSASTTEAATPSAVKTAYDLANQANNTANTTLSGLNGSYIYDQTFSITNGVATFTPHVYLKGAEVTSTFAASCFVWKYRLIDGSEVTLATKSDRGCDVTITSMGYGGHVIGSFTPPA